MICVCDILCSYLLVLAIMVLFILPNSSIFSVFQCGEVFHNTTRRFNYRSVQTGEIPLTDNCTWVILAEKMEFIDLSLLYINLPNSSSCELGSVKVSL